LLANRSFWAFAISGALISFFGWVISENRLEFKELRFWEWPLGKFVLAAVVLSLLAGLPAAVLGWRSWRRGRRSLAAGLCAAPTLVAASLMSIYDVTVIEGFLIVGAPLLGCALWSALRSTPRRWKVAVPIVLWILVLGSLEVVAAAPERILVHLAASGDVELATILLERGTNPDASHLEGKSPLMAAVEADDAEMVQLLVDWKASPHRLDASGDGPMMRSIEQRTTELTVILLGFHEPSEPTSYEPIEDTYGPSV
jgi:hypothetical protein